MDAEKFRQFTALLDVPPTPSLEIERLLAVETPWGKMSAKA